MRDSAETYDMIVLKSLRYLDMHDFTEINRMTMYEFCVRMQAARLRQVDREYELHLLAWGCWDVQSMKKQGKKRVPVYQTFRQFFDYEAREKEAYTGKQAEKTGIGVRIMQAMKRQKEGMKPGGKL